MITLIAGGKYRLNCSKRKSQRPPVTHNIIALRVGEPHKLDDVIQRTHTPHSNIRQCCTCFIIFIVILVIRVQHHRLGYSCKCHSHKCIYYSLPIIYMKYTIRIRIIWCIIQSVQVLHFKYKLMDSMKFIIKLVCNHREGSKRPNLKKACIPELALQFFKPLVLWKIR